MECARYRGRVSLNWSRYRVSINGLVLVSRGCISELVYVSRGCISELVYVPVGYQWNVLGIEGGYH